MPSVRSYRSARTNQNAKPPELCAGVRATPVARTPSEPLRPVFCHPRRSIIMRTSTPMACRKRVVRRTWTPARNLSMASCDSSSRTTPARGVRSWWSSDSSMRRWRSTSSKNASTSSKGYSASFTTSANVLPWRSSRKSSRVMRTFPMGTSPDFQQPALHGAAECTDTNIVPHKGAGAIATTEVKDSP